MSIEDQIGECQRWAEANGVDIAEGIFVDRGISGRKNRRPGFQGMRAAIEAKHYDVLITLTSSRLFRKAQNAIRFVDEEIVDAGLRCVFVSQNFDTEKLEHWKMFLALYAIFDEMQLSAQTGNIHAAHKTKLLAEQVHNSVPWGYHGVDDGKGLTRNGRPTQRIEVDESLRTWAEQVFRWYAHDRLNRADIAARLSAANVAPPPRAGVWTRVAVRRILQNPRYRGDWSYGRYKSVWRANTDYAHKEMRDKPLLELQIDRLRLVSDELFEAAQDRLRQLSAKHPGARRWKNDKGDRLPDPVQDLLQCSKHQRRLVVSGAKGECYSCLQCRRERPDDGLFSHVNRRVVLDRVIESVSGLLQVNEELLLKVQTEAATAIDKMVRPDPTELDELRRKRQKLTNDINFLIQNIGETNEERKETEQRLNELRSRRRDVDQELARMESANAVDLHVPTDNEIKTKVDDIQNVLQDAAASRDPDQLLKLRAVLESVTGGAIRIHQSGERRHKKGWLTGTFTPNLSILMAPLSVTADATAKPVAIDFRPVTTTDLDVDRIKTAFDAHPDWTIRRLAASLGMNETVTMRKLRKWHTDHGQVLPDLRSRGQTLKNQSTPTKARALADAAKALETEGLLLVEIARRLNVSRETATLALDHWYTSRGLARADGRSRRHTLAVKARAVPPKNLDGADTPPN